MEERGRGFAGREWVSREPKRMGTQNQVKGSTMYENIGTSGRGRGINGGWDKGEIYEQYQPTWGYGNQRGHYQYGPQTGCSEHNEQHSWRYGFQNGDYDHHQRQNWEYGSVRSGGNGSSFNNGGFNDEHNQQSWSRAWGRGGNGRGRSGRGPCHAGRTMKQHQQSGDGRDIWAGKSRGESSSSSNQERKSAYQTVPTDPEELNVQSRKISENKGQLLPSADNKIVPMRRPDRGTVAFKSVNLLANHFLVKFDSTCTIIHYDVDIKQAGNQSFKRSVPKALTRLIKHKLFCDKFKNFPKHVVAYDGERNIFSSVELPTGEFNVEFSVADDVVARSYTFTMKKVNELELSKLKDYLGGNLSYIPRDVLQGLDLVMRENPSEYRIPIGRSFYGKNYLERDDLRCGVAAYRGFHQSLKPTSQGLSLCLDYSILTLRKPLPIIEFLKESVKNFRGAHDVMRMRDEVIRALKGLKVRVTHRNTIQKYTISGLTQKTSRELSFDIVNPGSQTLPGKIGIVDYFWQRYRKEINSLDIPCLDLGKKGKNNFVPMEFCVLEEGQKYLKERLDKGRADFVKRISLACPEERKSTIRAMVQADDGPGGIVAKNFQMEVEKYMTSIEGRVLRAPELKLRAADGNVHSLTVEQDKCQWNLVGKGLVDGKRVERWALIDFTSTSPYKLPVQEFIRKLRNRSWNLGMKMEDPLVCHFTGMHEFSSADRIEKLIRKVIDDARRKNDLRGTELQLIVCVMARRDDGYKYLKWVSETKIGVVTQCCLSHHASRGQDQYLANLCLKINAKLGGSNVELNERLPHFMDGDSVMFIGADVNHPAAKNTTCPSIAAVVGTMNWPASNQYAARVQPQEHRKEKIMNFGSVCRDLVNTFAQLNNYKPKKIIVFRDGVSEGQFDMVLNEELLDLMQAICDDHYQPTITLVVAQKRHHTRLFLDRRDGGVSGNVPPGTVVDTKIVHPFEFDFYLCSHHGSLGTSKPTHYYVLWDENEFTSDKLQKLIFNLCFTYARCTKPVSLVPPVYYADLVAYRGRLFQEVAMEQFPARSSASLSSFGASFDLNFYTLHPDLKNIMYFV